MSDKKRALFICGTPFHVITCIILRYQLNIEADIIIYDAFSNIDKLRQNLEETMIFGDVKILNRNKDFGMPEKMISKYLFALFGYFRIKSKVERVIPEIRKYSDIFFANDQNTDIIDRFSFCYVKKYMKYANIYYIEDGLGSYHEDYFNLTTFDNLARKLIVRSKTNVIDTDIYLYSPQLYKLMNPQGTRIIRKIYAPDNNIKEKLKCVFKYVNDSLESYDTVIFDTVREEEFLGDGSERFSDVVSKLTSKRKTIVKPHPRENNKFFDSDYFNTAGIPFEVMCLYNDFSDYLFITNYSNAVFTPKLIFDQEPQIVFTFKLLNEYMKDKSDRDELIDCFKKIYTDSSKINVLEDFGHE